MSDVKTFSLDEIRAMRARCEIVPTRADAPEYDMPDGFWDTAVLQAPLVKATISMRVDPDILDFFKSQGSGHLTRMHSVLRAYVDAQQRGTRRK